MSNKAYRCIKKMGSFDKYILSNKAIFFSPLPNDLTPR